MKVQSSIVLVCLVGLASAQDRSVINSLISRFVSLFFNLVSGPSTDIFNNLIGDALTEFDPYDIDQEFEGEVAEIDLPNCPSNPTMVYALLGVNEVTGLSKFEVSDLRMTKFELNDDGAVSGFEVDLESGEDLILNVDGKIGPSTADCATYEAINFTGYALLSNPVIKFGFEGDIQLTDFQVKSGNVTTFEFSWDELSFTFSDLGYLQDVVDEITTSFTEPFEELAQTLINKTFVQNAIDGVLPFPSKRYIRTINGVKYPPFPSKMIIE